MDLLGQQIEKMREKLHNLVQNDPSCLSRTDVVRLSQKLDKLINLYYEVERCKYRLRERPFKNRYVSFAGNGETVSGW